MKSIRRILVVSLSIIILSVNIATFGFKPIQAKAAVAVPVAAIGSVVWDLLITAFVAAGVYDIMDDYDKQKMVYDDFFKSVKVLDPPLPDIGEDDDIFFPDITVPDITKPDSPSGIWWGLGKGQIDNLLDLELFVQGGPNSSIPPDNNSWKGLPPIDFILGASMLAKITTYVADLWADDTSEVHATIFGTPSDLKHNWNGAYEREVSNYVIRFDFTGNTYLDAYKNKYHVRYSSYRDSAKQICAKPIVGVLGDNIIHIYNLGLGNGKYYLNLASYGLSVWRQELTLDGQIIREQRNPPYIESANFNGNFPVFYTEESAFAFLKGQTVPDSAYANKVKKKPYVPNFSTSIPALPSILYPLIRPNVTKPLSTDTLVNAITDVETKLQPKLEKAVETGVPLEAPVYDKIFTDSLNDAITKTETEAKPDPKPDPPVTKPDVEQGNPDDLLADLKSVFPFCIPFDLIHAFTVLQADAKPPRFEVPLKALKYGIDYTFVIDLEIFDPVAKIFRTCETIGFIVGLIFVTRKLIKG